MKDILIFLSDQHDGRIQHHNGDTLVRTPHLDALAREGVSYSNAYTPCPLCIPARMSLLSGQLPSHTGVFTNSGSLHPETPTFLHSLAASGYETVLCGRMHFEGDDQRHGFTKRIADDITPTAPGSLERSLEGQGVGGVLMTGIGCLFAVGSGSSASTEYDLYVVSKALEYLAQPHDKPQCIVVGTYGPHHPYIAPQELYDYYHDRVTLPENLEIPAPGYAAEKPVDRDPDLVRAVRAAYYGLVEFEDRCVGTVRQAWNTWLQKNGRKGIFAYISDHGDHIGERGLYGKQTLFEPSLRVPMLFAGDGIPAGVRLDTPVSLLDIAPTVLELAQAEALPFPDGQSLAFSLLGGKEPRSCPVIAEWINGPYSYGTHFGRMIREGDRKFVCFPDFPEEDLLTDPGSDYWELQNLCGSEPETAAAMRSAALDGLDTARIVEAKNRRFREQQMITRFVQATGQCTWEVWEGNEACRSFPDKYVRSGLPVPPRFKEYLEPRKQYPEQSFECGSGR